MNSTTEDQLAETRLDRWLKRTPLILLAAFLLYRLFAISIFRTPKHIDVAALNLQTLGNKPIPPSKLQGKVVLLNYWAPWCGPCLVEIPSLRNLQTAHSNNLVIIGVVNDESDYLRGALLMADSGVTYPQAKVSPALDKVVGRVNEIPLSFFVSPTGDVIHRVSGPMTPEQMESYFADSLHAPASR